MVKGKMVNHPVVTEDDIKIICSMIEKYASKCFIDAFNAENRTYDESAWSFDFIIIKKDDNPKYYLCPSIWCKYNRVKNRVLYRMSNNLLKNFGVHFGKDDDLRYITYKEGQIDPNHTRAMFNVKRSNRLISLSIFTGYYEDEVDWNFSVPANIYRELLLKYFNISSKDLDVDENIRIRHVQQGDINYQRKYVLPDEFRIGKNWDKFRNLYKDTFNKYPEDGFIFITSSGIEQIKGE